MLILDPTLLNIHDMTGSHHHAPAQLSAGDIEIAGRYGYDNTCNPMVRIMTNTPL